MACTAKHSTINRAAPLPHLELRGYCADLENWPRSWMGLEKDLPAGQALVACFQPFLEYLVHSNLSRKTIRKTYRQPVAAGRRDHSRSESDAFSEEGLSGATAQ